VLINIGAQPGAANAVAFVLDRPGVAAWPSWPLIDGQRRISADTALRLARFFGTSERFWINLQSRYDLEIEKDRLGDALDGIRPLTAAS
jgi:plasmid maintenance system antidote protein VapI